MTNYICGTGKPGQVARFSGTTSSKCRKTKDTNHNYGKVTE